MWKGKVDGQSNHLRTLIWVLFVHAMSGECHHKTNSKAHHLKSTSKRGNSLSLQGRSSVAHDWHSMMIVTQSMGDNTLFWVINVSLQNMVITNRIVLLIPVQLREISSCFLENQREWIRRTKGSPVNQDIQII